MKSFINSIIFLLVLAGLGGAFYAWKNSNRESAPPLPAVRTTPVTETAPSPSPSIAAEHYPVPEETAASKTVHPLKPVPSLDESDPTIAEALSELVGAERFKAVFHLQDIIRRIVVTIENAASPIQTSDELLPFKQPEGEFAVTGKKNQKDATISPNNYRRYQPYVELAEAVDPQELVRIYFHFYPIFQAAYADLGTKGYFNDRVIQAIDHLLKTPEVEDPIRVTRPSIRYKYKFADDRLENLSSTQKVLVRMGPRNAELIKKKLRKIRKLLAAQK
jgi:hypothetical protein